MSSEAFDVEAALEKCHKGTAWQRDLIREQLIAARAAALEEAAREARMRGAAMLLRGRLLMENPNAVTDDADAALAEGAQE